VTSEVITIEKPITVYAMRASVTAKVYNSSGEEVAVLPTIGVNVPVYGMEVDKDTNPLSPDIYGLEFANILLKDKDHNVIDLDPSTSKLDGLRWYGRACPNTPDRVCPTPTSGQIVNNGVYLIQVTSVDRLGETIVVTGMLTVSHGKLEMIVAPKAIPNPASRWDLTNNPNARIWVAYQVGMQPAALKVKIYNVAGELIREVDAKEQTWPSDPLGVQGACCQGTFAWDGRNKDGTVCAPGIYAVVIEASDASGNRQREIVKIAIQEKSALEYYLKRALGQ